MADINEIERQTKDFADARGLLKERVENLDEAIATIKRRLLPGIKNAAAAALKKQEDLKETIEGNKHLFEKPRSITIHGVKVGLQKSTGGLKWEDKDLVVKLIKKHFSEQVDVLIKKTETPVKSALKQLTVAELQSVAVEVKDTGDVALIKSTDSDIDKLVAAILKEDEEEEIEEAA